MTLNDLIRAILARGHDCQIVLDTRLIGLSKPTAQITAKVQLKNVRDNQWRTAGTLDLAPTEIHSYHPELGYEGSILERAMTEGGA